MRAERMRFMEACGRDIAKSLQVAFDRFGQTSAEKWGFALMIFSFEGPEFTWISNAQRADMVKAMEKGKMRKLVQVMVTPAKARELRNEGIYHAFLKFLYTERRIIDKRIKRAQIAIGKQRSRREAAWAKQKAEYAAKNPVNV